MIDVLVTVTIVERGGDDFESTWSGSAPDAGAIESVAAALCADAARERCGGARGRRPDRP